MSQAGALVKRPIRVIAMHRGEKISEQVYQHTPIRIGRLLDNDVVLPFDFISRFHCELRFEGEQWTAVDLGSKNGLQTDAVSRAREVAINDGDKFSIQEITIQLIHEAEEELSVSFGPSREDATVIGDSDLHRVKGVPRLSHQAAANDSSRPIKSKSGPVLEVNVTRLLLGPHPGIFQQNSAKALQLVTMWHDQVLDTREIPIGCPLRLELFGHVFRLGVVKKEKTKVKLPKGSLALVSPSGEVQAAKHLMVSHGEPIAFRFGNDVVISIRYVPKSLELARSSEWVEQPLVDPLLSSGAAHGAAALTAIFLAPHKQPVVQIEEPERFAQILVQPTPMQVAVLDPTPTPMPTPLATPEPTPLATAKPEPPKIVKRKELEKEPDKEKIKVVVDNKKRRKLAEMRKEDPGREHDKPVEVAKVLDAPSPEQPPEAAPPAPPVPQETPQPFNAKSVGALKMLSALPVGPASEIANVEKIQISRAPASTTGSLVGRETVTGTGEMISKLSQSVSGSGRTEGVDGVAVGKGTAGGKYQMAGLAGKAGNRKIRGTVLGGATYSELTKNEGLTREQVMKVVERHQSQIQMCYERALMLNPDIVGRAEFEWEIAPQGHVTSVKVKEATVRNGDNLLECVKGVFAGMKFPVAKNGEATTPTIGLPFGRL